MKKNLIIIAVIFVIIVLFSTPFAIAENGYINLTLSQEKEISPDTVEIIIGVETSNKDSKLAIDENKKISNQVQSKIKTLIDEAKGDFIKTSNYTLSPRSIYKDNKSVFDKYVVNNNVVVHTKSLENVSKIIDTATQAGATNINNLNFSIEEYDSICTKMIANLVGKSKNQAIQMVKSTGAKVKGIRSIDTSCSPQNVYPRAMYSTNMAKDAIGAEATPIEKGKLKLNATVNASFFVK